MMKDFINTLLLRNDEQDKQIEKLELLLSAMEANTRIEQEKIRTKIKQL